MCDCQSYNLRVGTVPERVLPAPAWSSRDSICVDGCIADTIQALWAANIRTYGCCCGHNGRVSEQPVVMVENGARGRALSVITRADRRKWEVVEIREVSNDQS